MAVIAVAGEALIDLIIDASGVVRARPGGGPFNVARTVARLGQESHFVGRISSDRFGQLLRSSLEADGVRLTGRGRSPAAGRAGPGAGQRRPAAGARLLRRRAGHGARSGG